MDAPAKLIDMLTGAGQVRCLHSAAALQLLLMFVYITNTWRVHAQSVQFAQPKPISATRISRDCTSGISTFTFHGPIRSGSEAHQVQVLLHVFLKTKRQDDNTFIVRTVSYTERVQPQGMSCTPYDCVARVTKDYCSTAALQVSRLCTARKPLFSSVQA